MNSNENFTDRSNSEIRDSLLNAGRLGKLKYKLVDNTIEIEKGKFFGDKLLSTISVISFILLMIFCFTSPGKHSHQSFSTFNYITLALVLCGFGGCIILFAGLKSYMVFDFNKSSFYIINRLYGKKSGENKCFIPFNYIKGIGVNTKAQRKTTGGKNPKPIPLLRDAVFARDILRLENAFSFYSFIVIQTKAEKIEEISEIACDLKQYKELVLIASGLNEALGVPLAVAKRSEKLVLDKNSSEKNLITKPIFDEADFAKMRAELNGNKAFYPTETSI